MGMPAPRLLVPRRAPFNSALLPPVGIEFDNCGPLFETVAPLFADNRHCFSIVLPQRDQIGIGHNTHRPARPQLVAVDAELDARRPGGSVRQ